MKWGFSLGLLLAGIWAMVPARAADWSRIGADAGLSKYSPDNVPASISLQLQYAKRFYGKFAPDRGNFFYGSSVVTRGGMAVIIADDRQTPPASDYVSFMEFDWSTGKTEAYYTTPFPLRENDREVDSHHYSNPIIWHDDGRVYMRRGGDHSGMLAFLPATGQLIPIYYRDSQGTILSNGIDATALMQAYRNMLIYRYGHTFYTTPYWAVSIDNGSFATPNLGPQWDMLGTCVMDVGPSVPGQAGPDGLYGSTGRYGDIPKCAGGICVMAASAYSSVDSYPNNIKLWLEAADLVTGEALWTKVWNSDAGGQKGFSTSVSDYWRFVATDSGIYVFFTRAAQSPVTVRAVDLRTGQEVWSKPLADSRERPILACHAGYVYVIGRAEQYKLDAATGEAIWHTYNSWPHDQGYVLGNHDLGSVGALSQDPLFRPAVLTDDTLWFVDGDSLANSVAASAGTLVGLRTSDGQVVERLDLRSYYSDRPDEALLVVNDVLVADGLLGVLVGVKDAQSPHPNSNGMDYQDLYVYKPVRTGDVNSDGAVNVGDLMAMAAAWGGDSDCPGFDSAADLNGDGHINVGDLQILIENWAAN